MLIPFFPHKKKSTIVSLERSMLKIVLSKTRVFFFISSVTKVNFNSNSVSYNLNCFLSNLLRACYSGHCYKLLHYTICHLDMMTSLPTQHEKKESENSSRMLQGECFGPALFSLCSMHWPDPCPS